MYTYTLYTVHMSYHRIYIAKAVEKKFLEEPNKSGLLNDLLLEHYGVAPSSRNKYYPERREVTVQKTVEFCKHQQVKGLCKQGCR